MSSAKGLLFSLGLNELMCRDQINLVQHCKYLGCWCPGSLCRQDISTHDVDWLCRIGKFLSYLENDFDSLCHVKVEEWHKM